MKTALVAMIMTLLFIGSNAFADARQHFLAGKDYYAQAKYQKSIDEFEEAYRLDPRPLLLYNISQAHEKLGNLHKTVDTLKKFLEADPDTNDRSSLLSKIANLEARIAKTGLKLIANEVEATVFIDGKEHSKTPVTGVIKLPPGQHKIRVAKKGFSDFTMAVSISTGLTAKIEVELEPGKSNIKNNNDRPESVNADEAAEEAEADPDKSKAMDILPWIVAGVGVAAVGVGWGVIGSMAVSQGDESGSKDEIADIIAFPGIALAITGTIWGIIRIKRKNGANEDPTEPEIALLPIIGKDTNGVAAVIHF